MIRLTITPITQEKVYSLLKKKELELRRKNQGTLHAAGPRRVGKEKWTHSSYKGWIQFQQCLGGVVVAEVKSRDAEAEWRLINSSSGFSTAISEPSRSITLTYDQE